LVSLHDKFGLSKEHAARIGIASAGLWWALFTIYCMRFLHEPRANEALPEKYRRRPRWLAFLSLGVERTWHTAKRAMQFRHLILFLLAYMTYNEGIQTVINMATIYGSNELHLPASALMFTLLIIQFVAIFGSIGFSKIADRLGTRRAIIFGLLIWSGVVVYAYFINSTKEFFALGMIVGLTLGGTQALSRSYYGSMIPEDSSAEFFGFYTVFSKFSAIWGPWAFAAITYFSHSARTAIVSLITFFIVGLILLVCVDETKARAARTLAAF
jgi:UMF1 family MFS transporter